ncbi:hypothetical protein HG535_0D00940 [Zygotorulaspora mrakii]|uniref:Uncharacterized protein n=1 Tax=Zygotorulaspora mrakii TaxID=42260 RepID=A0A7H9B1S7_ZYGMR|nr:uncharacterized protein HG535_0D00940 [Zygotorulaspora mrakii]QLG72386.1 hypothetical protein HG535_0D00940 [Zygotorulaspora mrakii]
MNRSTYIYILVSSPWLKQRTDKTDKRVPKWSRIGSESQSGPIMSAVLRKLSIGISAFQIKGKKDSARSDFVGKVEVQIDVGAPNNNLEYIKSIEKLIVLKLVEPTEHIEDVRVGGQSGNDNTIIKATGKESTNNVGNAGNARNTKNVKTTKATRTTKSTSTRLNREKIRRMIEFDEPCDPDRANANDLETSDSEKRSKKQGMYIF